MDGPHGDRPMTLIDHLIELRRRLLYSVIALAVGFVVCFHFANEIFNFLSQPLITAFGDQLQGRRFIFTKLYEPFLTQVKIGLLGALFVAFPFLALQLWRFVAPGLYRHERGAFLPFLIASPVLFLMGGALAYFIAAPTAFHFFLTFEQGRGDGLLPIQLEPRMADYFGLIMQFIFAFGLCFQLPVLLSLLGRVGIVTSRGLIGAWRYALVGIFVAAGILTPPDALSMMLLATPLTALYGLSIVSVRLIERQRQRRAERAMAQGSGSSGFEETDFNLGR